MVLEPDQPDMPGTAVLYLDQGNGEIIDLGGAARSLLGIEQDLPAGTRWREVLGITGGIADQLAAAIRAGSSVPIPPLLVCPPGGGERVMAGWLAPAIHRGHACARLMLDEVAPPDELAAIGSITATDTLVLLGVDRLPNEQWQTVENIDRLMVDVRLGLLQIVPATGVVGLPMGTTVPVLLRATAIAEAHAMAPALLSHLHTALAANAVGAGTRLRVGLAQPGHEQGPLAVLVAANNALLLAQSSDTDARVGTAGRADGATLLARACSAHGCFSARLPAHGQSRYLSALATLAVDPHHCVDYVRGACELTARQEGIVAAAVYRRRQDDSFDYVAGVLAGTDRARSATEQQLPKPMRSRFRAGDFSGEACISGPAAANYPLRIGNHISGCLLIGYQDSLGGDASRFVPGTAALHHMAGVLAGVADWRGAEPGAAIDPPGGAHEIEVRPEAYVSDNLEGAIDQAAFLARVDVPVAVVGARGTGKLFVAKFIHREWGGAPDQLVLIDCREFRSRRDALARIKRELAHAQGRTLVFKSPHLMNPDAQLALARQISSRILADTKPPRYLPRARYVALFPRSIEHLMAFAGLEERLASAFAAYPIEIPPLKDRKRAVLRWAHKILGQESALRDRITRGFTPDAEQALREHPWPGNISEMREAISAALDKTDKEWITPVDLGIFRGVGVTGEPAPAEPQPFLADLLEEDRGQEHYVGDVLEELGVALAQALHNLLASAAIKPLGSWLEDELILAVCERFRGDLPGAAHFLHTKARNVSRWLPKIEGREQDRNASALWQTPRRLVRQWVQEAAPQAVPPQQQLQAMLMRLVVAQCDTCTVAEKARIMGVSTPTYQKRLQQILTFDEQG